MKTISGFSRAAVRGAIIEKDGMMTDEEIERIHGDDKAHPIAEWRKEFEAGGTTLEYIDWRADRKWCAARERG